MLWMLLPKHFAKTLQKLRWSPQRRSQVPNQPSHLSASTPAKNNDQLQNRKKTQRMRRLCWVCVFCELFFSLLFTMHTLHSRSQQEMHTHFSHTVLLLLCSPWCCNVFQVSFFCCIFVLFFFLLVFRLKCCYPPVWWRQRTMAKSDPRTTRTVTDTHGHCAVRQGLAILLGWGEPACTQNNSTIKG